MRDTGSDPTAKLLRQLRLTQLGLAVALVGVALPFVGVGPAPSELRARHKVVVGPSREMVLSASEDRAVLTYQNPEGVGFDLYCGGDHCSLSLRSKGESRGLAEIVASDDPRLQLFANSDGSEKGPSKGHGSATLSPGQMRLSSATASGDGFVALDPSQLHLARTRQGSVLIEADETPNVSLSGTNSFRVYRSTDPEPAPPP
jgi:hypothetical protein